MKSFANFPLAILLIFHFNFANVLGVPVTTEKIPTEVDDSDFDVDGDILLLEWIPYPINKYRYIIFDTDDEIPKEQGVTTLEVFTKENYPNVSIALAVVPGDVDYIYLKDIQLISVDAFKHDHFFQEYQDIIFTIHGFSYKVELWAHFLEYIDAFWPVRDRLSEAFNDYLNNPVVTTEIPKIQIDPAVDFGPPSKGH